jgi:hypothetical protein
MKLHKNESLRITQYVVMLESQSKTIVILKNTTHI